MTALSLLLAAMMLLPCCALAAQNERLDVGSFTVLQHGQRSGREQFSMQRIASQEGAMLELRSESALGDRRTAMRLETDSAGTPQRYSVEQRRGADLFLRLGGQRTRGRFATLARSLVGESAREYLLRPGAVVLEAEGFVQYALLVNPTTIAQRDSLELATLTPIANTQGVVRMVRETRIDTVDIAGARREASRWRLRTEAGELRMVWSDAQGRLLRVTIPTRGLEARRDDVPRDDVPRDDAPR